MTLPVRDPRTTSVRPFVHGDQRDDQLGRVAEGRVQEAADPRARVLRRMLGRLADEPRERDQRHGRENELERLRRVDEVVQRDGERAEREQREEDCDESRSEKATDDSRGLSRFDARVATA